MSDLKKAREEHYRLPYHRKNAVKNYIKEYEKALKETLGCLHHMFHNKMLETGGKMSLEDEKAKEVLEKFKED